MSTTAKLHYLRIAPRKVRLVADMIRGKSVEEAQNILNFTTKKAAGVLMKILKSAIASAKNNLQLEESNLYIGKILIDEGPKNKRWRPRARGQAYEIQKKTSHVTLVLNEIEKAKKPKKKREAKKIEKVEKPQPISETPKKISEEEKGRYEAGRPPAFQAKPEPEKEKTKPEVGRGIRRIFQRRGY